MLRVNRRLVLVAAAAVTASALLAWSLTSPSMSLGQATDIGLPTDVAEQAPTAPQTPALPPQAPVEPPTAAESPAGQQPAAAALPSAGIGGFQSAGGVLMPTLLLAIAGGGLLAFGALTGLATTRRKN